MSKKAVKPKEPEDDCPHQWKSWALKTRVDGRGERHESQTYKCVLCGKLTEEEE